MPRSPIFQPSSARTFFPLSIPGKWRHAQRLSLPKWLGASHPILPARQKRFFLLLPHGCFPLQCGNRRCDWILRPFLHARGYKFRTPSASGRGVWGLGALFYSFSFHSQAQRLKPITRSSRSGFSGVGWNSKLRSWPTDIASRSGVNSFFLPPPSEG